MAQQGNYADPPSRRMAYDADGSVIGYIDVNSNSITTISGSSLNTEDYVVTYNTGGTGGARRYFVIFPEKRDVTYIFRNLDDGTYYAGSQTGAVEVSTNTTTGLDGTWTKVMDHTAVVQATEPAYRNPTLVPGATAIKAIRVYLDGGSAFNRKYYCQWHIWGRIHGNETPHRIDLADIDGSELLIDTDYGDQPRSVSRIWQPTETWNQSSALYLYNRSTTKVAQNVVIATNALFGSMVTYVTLSKDNITYANSLTYAEIQPSAKVGPIYIKHAPPSNQTLGIDTMRLKVTVGSWL